MKIPLILISIISLYGCCRDPVIVKPNFPDLPSSLEKGCEDLALVQQNTDKLSDILDTVTKNYAKYHECKIKVETWKSWYTDQRKIYESIK